MSDLISRQAAIDELKERIMANGYSNVALVSELNRSIGYLMRLPSAHPEIEERKEESAQNVPKEDWISRKAAIALANSLKDDLPDDERIADTVMAHNEGILEYQTKLSLLPSAQSEPQWIPVSERLPEEDHWLGGSGKQFSDNVLVSILNSDDEDEWVDVSQTIDGEWALELPRHCKILAWMPLPEPYREERRTDGTD